MSRDHVRHVLGRAVEDDTLASPLATDEALLTGHAAPAGRQNEPSTELAAARGLLAPPCFAGTRAQP